MLKYALYLIFYLILPVYSSVKFIPDVVEFELNVNSTVHVSVSNQNKSVWLHLNTSSDSLGISPTALLFPHDETFTIIARSGGYSTVFISNTSVPIEGLKRILVQVIAYHYEELNLFSIIVGWSYFVAWSFSFYPQIVKNFSRKSVVGFNFDFLCLNTLGHTSYLVYNSGFYFVPVIQNQYFEIHPHGFNPVKINDVLFSIHAVFATLVQCTQCCIYERGGQVISKACRMILVAIFLFLGISVILTTYDVITWLTLLYYFSYIKLGITFVKYCPQVYANYKAQSTNGFSVGYALFDFLGGTQSVLQMFLNAYNFDDWPSIVGNITKLGLGLVSISFDIIFMFQHFVLYRNEPEKPQDVENEKKEPYDNSAFADVTSHL